MSKTVKYLQFNIIILVFLMMNCFGDSHFSTYAEYKAPKSGFIIRIMANGIVPSGHDLSETYTGRVLICPVLTETGKGIQLFLNDREAINYTIFETSMTGEDQWNWKTALEKLNSFLLLAGYKDLDDLEIREAISAINGVMAGPKGTIMAGQSQVLQVLEVDYRYKKFSKEITEKAHQQMSNCN